MTDRELLQQVLDALEHLHRTGDTQVFDLCDAPVLIPALRSRLAQPEQPAQYDCCANCLRPEREHNEGECPKPYTTVWHAWDYAFQPEQPAKDPCIDGSCTCCWTDLDEQPAPEPVAWHEPGAYGNVTVHKEWAERNGWLPLFTA